MAEKVVIGNAELWHGDCREVLPLLPKHDLLLTDPPYGIGFAAQPGNDRRKAGQAPEKWDDETPPDWIFGLMREKAAAQIIWGGNYYPLPPSRGWLSWFKPDGPPSYGHFELAWTSLDMVCKQFERTRGGEKRDQEAHPTQKPLECFMMIGNHGSSGDVVYDPFLGSGTTMVACQNLSRKCRAIEISPNYCAVILERMATAFPGIEIERIER